MAQAFLDELLQSSNSVLPENEDDRDCIICFQETGVMNRDTGFIEIRLRLPCNHIVGSGCISTWLKQNNTCPICRREFFPAQPRQYLEHGIMEGQEDEAEDEISEDGEWEDEIRTRLAEIRYRLADLENGQEEEDEEDGEEGEQGEEGEGGVEGGEGGEGGGERGGGADGEVDENEDEDSVHENHLTFVEGLCEYYRLRFSITNGYTISYCLEYVTRGLATKFIPSEKLASRSPRSIATACVYIACLFVSHGTSNLNFAAAAAEILATIDAVDMSVIDEIFADEQTIHNFIERYLIE